MACCLTETWYAYVCVCAEEIAYGLVSILLITPLLGLLVAQLPLYPRPLAFGLGVVCTVPTALACGVAFVQVGAMSWRVWASHHIQPVMTGRLATCVA